MPWVPTPAGRGPSCAEDGDAVPVGDDPGDWTVVLYHVGGGPEEITPVVCNGFHA